MTESIGIDVAKHELVVCTYPTHRHAAFPNDLDGRRQLVAWVHLQAPERIVLESTSTYHLAAACALYAADPAIIATAVAAAASVPFSSRLRNVLWKTSEM